MTAVADRESAAAAGRESPAAAAGRESAAAQTRWDHWAGRYQRSSRRQAKHARIAATLIFVAVVGNLLVQLFARPL